MLLPALDLDADMTCDQVLDRLARNGYWNDPSDFAAASILEPLAARLGRPVDLLVKSLAHDVRTRGAAIRRQWGTSVLWYAMPLARVLQACHAGSPRMPLLDALGLHETDGVPVTELARGEPTPLGEGVVLDHGRPVSVSLPDPAALQPPGSGYRGVVAPTAQAPGGASGGSRSSAIDRSYGAPSRAAAPAVDEPAVGSAQAWPRLDAPDFQPAGAPFDVVVGLALAQQAGVSGGRLQFPLRPGQTTLDLTIALSCGGGVDAPGGWTRTLSLPVEDLASQVATFTLVGREPDNAERATLTTLEARYVMAGTVCGVATRPLVVLPAGSAAHDSPRPFGTPWHATAPAATPVTLVPDAAAPDLTIEITKPDRNAASGQYACQLFSPHPLATPAGPFPMSLGQDARTFARALVDEVRLFSSSPLLDNTLEGVGRLVADRLPPAVMAAVREAAGLAGGPPALLLVSAEPFVPWELAWMDPPLDPARPATLGAQCVMGRWLRDDAPPRIEPVTEREAAALAATPPARPPLNPVAALDVRHLAVMAAWYQDSSGLRKLPQAEDEARQLADTFHAVPLTASATALKQLLDAHVDFNFERVTPDAVHFAGHGDFDPGRPDGSALFLMDGTPLRSNVFRTARYGGTQPAQPLLFLNACMLGIGGELLGDMAGFPGNSLRGGFGGVLGALWEVDDTLAHDLALEFWQRALPPAPARGEPVGQILRDLRGRYTASGQAVPTWLAYVYYGHPRLTLTRAA